MRIDLISARYNERIDPMKFFLGALARRLFLASFLLAVVLSSLPLFAANLDDPARRLADRIAAVTGPGSIALEVSNRSSLDEKSVRGVQSATEAQLRVDGVRTVTSEGIGTVHVVLSENLREYVWTAEITIGTDQPRIVLVSTPRPAPSSASATSFPVTLKKSTLFSQQDPILDAIVLGDSAVTPVGAASIGLSPRLIVLDPAHVSIYHQRAGNWEMETSLPVTLPRPLPRDPRGRLFLRSDHLFDAYLPGTICRSSAAAPLSMTCNASDDPWPLLADTNQSNVIRAFYAPARNFFTGVLSPAIGRISNVPSFYTAATIARPSYTLWVLTAVDGKVHAVDGITDQVVPAEHWGSDLAAVRSNCVSGTQLITTGSGDADHDSLRAFEMPDRDPVAVSSPMDIDGTITALWTDAAQTNAIAVVKRGDWYEADRITVSCAN